MTGYRHAVNPQELAYCSICYDPLLYIYESGVRKDNVCYPCMIVSAAYENAQKILREGGKK